MNLILAFAIIQLINVFFGTIKTIVTVKSGPMTAGLVNTLNYTINAIATKLLVSQDVNVIIAVACISNLIGVPLAKLLLDKLQKERLWVYNATIRCNEYLASQIRSILKNSNGVHSTYEAIAPNELYSMKFFAYKKEDSKAIKEILKKLNAKYYIIEPR